MYVGFAVPLAILALVVAGVVWGVLRADRTEPVAATKAPSAQPRPMATSTADRAGAPDLPLAMGGGLFPYRVAGTDYRQDTLVALRDELLRARRHTRVDGTWGAFVAELRPQPENPHDPDAVSVDAPGCGTVGWLSRGDGARYIPLIQTVRKRGLPLGCPAVMSKGADGSLGVRLDLAAPAAIAARLQVNLRDISTMPRDGMSRESEAATRTDPRTPVPTDRVGDQHPLGTAG